jgi:hypothetical protein
MRRTINPRSLDMHRITSAFALAVVATGTLTSDAAYAQQKKMSVSDVERACVGRQSVLHRNAAEFCARTAAEARKRYGESVTNTQWASASRVAGHKLSQGR